MTFPRPIQEGESQTNYDAYVKSLPSQPDIASSISKVQSTMSSAPKQLAATDILSKMQTGTPMLQGEKLPDVPKGMSAKGFYGQFPGGASVYSQAPFKQPTYQQQVPVTPQQPTQPSTPVDTAPTTPTPQIDIYDQQGGDDAGGSPTETYTEDTTSQQVNDLLEDVDVGYTLEFDPDLSLIEDLSNNYE